MFLNKIFRLMVTIAMISLLFRCTSTRNPQPDVKPVTYGPGWSAVHADAGNTDYAPITGSTHIQFAWQRKLNGTINLGPTSGPDGTIYVTTSGSGCHLYALDAKTGETIWCSDQVNKFAVASSALVDQQGQLYIGDDEAMHAFDAAGKLLWQTPITGFPFSSQFTPTGRLIFITHIGRIYVLDPKTGEAILPPVHLLPDELPAAPFDPRACMRGTKDCPCSNTLAMDQQTGRFFFTFWAPGSSQASLRAMQYTESPTPSIKELWTNDALAGGSASSPDLSSDGTKVYVNDNITSIYAIDAASGNIIWEYNIGYQPGGSQSTSPDGYIMPAGGSEAGLMCIKDNGTVPELLWRNDSLQNRGIATQTAGNLAYVTLKAGIQKYDVAVVDVLTGQILDRKPLPGSPLFSVGTTIGQDGTVYVPTFDGYLYAFQPE